MCAHLMTKWPSYNLCAVSKDQFSLLVLIYLKRSTEIKRLRYKQYQNTKKYCFYFSNCFRQTYAGDILFFHKQVNFTLETKGSLTVNHIST